MAVTKIRETQVREITRTWEIITQSSHGFSAGNVVYFNGLVWALAKADNIATAEALGVVESSLTTDTFVLIFQGHIVGLSSLVAGETYFISATTAGTITTTEPSGDDISKPILVALSTTEGIVNNWRGLTGGGTGGNDATVLRSTITQSSHGFSAGDVLRHNGTTYVGAQADTEANSAAIGVVESVIDVNNYVLAYSGLISVASASYTPGAVYYLSASAAGAVTTTPPTIKKQVFIAISATAAILLIDSIGGSGGGDVSGPGPTVIDESIAVWDGTGGYTLKESNVTVSADDLSTTGIITAGWLAADYLNLDGGAFSVEGANILAMGYVLDSVFTIADETEPTKAVEFQCSGITLDTTRTLTIPDKNGTIALLDDITGGDVSGPGSSTNNAISLWDGTDGDALKNSVVTISGSGDMSGINSINVNSVLTINSSGQITALAGIDDNVAVILQNGDYTAKARIDIGSVSTGVTRVLSVQDKDGTIALTSDLQAIETGIYMFGL